MTGNSAVSVNELMVEDYFTVAESNPTEIAVGCAKVVGIDRKISIEPYTISFEYTFYDDEGKECIALNSCSIGRLRPIPLTPEILEKNSTVRKELNRHDFEILFDDYSDASLVKCIGDSEHGYHDVEYICDVKYVHTLQHALKLCGIDKEIVL